jgi:hypothetical protein
MRDSSFRRASDSPPAKATKYLAQKGEYEISKLGDLKSQLRNPKYRWERSHYLIFRISDLRFEIPQFRDFIFPFSLQVIAA